MLNHTILARIIKMQMGESTNCDCDVDITDDPIVQCKGPCKCLELPLLQSNQPVRQLIFLQVLKPSEQKKPNTIATTTATTKLSTGRCDCSCNMFPCYDTRRPRDTIDPTCCGCYQCRHTYYGYKLKSKRERCDVCYPTFKDHFNSLYFQCETNGECDSSDPENDCSGDFCCTAMCCIFKLPLFSTCILGAGVNDCINYIRGTDFNYLF